jgi:hypothetical protein
VLGRARHRWQLENSPFLVIQLGHQALLPLKVAFGRFQVAIVPVVNKKQKVDAPMVCGNIGR